MVDQAPRYLSLSAADLILSEIRPTKIRPETLCSVNILIDEILWLILNSARSLATEKLGRDGLLRILPTTLGKEALLEAEIELKAYWDRTDPTRRGTNIDHPTKVTDFPLQTAFELLRLKCEIYSTLGDAEEDPDEEKMLQTRMMLAGPTPPPAAAVPPAALYITAVLEHICEHILANVAKVVARDSSRTSARIHDLYVALCEDDMMYPLFKRMKVKEDMEIQTEAYSLPRRSKSTSIHTRGQQTSNGRDGPGVVRSNTSTPLSSRGLEPHVNRTSGESSGSQGQTAPSARNSQEKSKLRMFGVTRSPTPSSQHEMGGSTSVLSHRRTGSDSVDERRPTTSGGGSVDVDDDAASTAEFESLMSSGATMKVSLTPDRLKSFEVLAKQKGKRGGRAGSRSNSISNTEPAPGPTSPSSSSTAPSPSSFPSPITKPLAHKSSRSNFIPRPALNVEAIEEDEDEDGLFVDETPERTKTDTGKPNGAAGIKTRNRTQSLAQVLQEPPPWDALVAKSTPPSSGPSSTKGASIPARVRSNTTGSNPSSLRGTKNLEAPLPPSLAVSKVNKEVPPAADVAAPPIKKKTLGLGLISSPSQTISPPSSYVPLKPGSKLNRTPRKAAKHLDDTDGDDLTANSEVDDETLLNTPTLALPPRKKNSPGVGNSPVSATTREMMDFLSEGPPLSPRSSPLTPPNTAPPGPTPKTKTGSRLGRMISRLARSGSSEHMKGSGKHAAVAPFPTMPMPKPPPPPPVTPPTIFAPQAKSHISAVENLQSTSTWRSKPTAATSSPSPQQTSPGSSSLQESGLADGTKVRSLDVPEVHEPSYQPQLSVQDSSPRNGSSTSVKSELVQDLAPLKPATFSDDDHGRQSTSSASHYTTSQSEHIAAPPTPLASTMNPDPSLQHAAVGPPPFELPPTSTIRLDKGVETETGAPSTPAPLPVGSAVVTEQQAQQLRDMVAKATSASECAVLVEMFLARWGLQRASTEADMGTPESGMDVDDAESPIVNVLLGESLGTLEADLSTDGSDTDGTQDPELKTPNAATDHFMPLPDLESKEVQPDQVEMATPPSFHQVLT